MPANPRKNSSSETEKLKQTITELPQYCVMFFMAKANTLATNTRLGYAIDLKTFFWYLISTMPDRFPYPKISDIPLETLNTLISDDIVMYLAYLEEYTMPDSTGSYPTKTGPNGQPEIIVYHNSAQGKKRKLAALRTFFSYMMVNRKLSNDPTVYVEIPKLHKKEVVTMTTKEENKFKNAVKIGKGKTKRGHKFFEKYQYRDYSIVLLFLETGVRVSELCDMELFDLDLEEQRILVIRKGGNQQYVYFKKDTLSTLLSYLELERPQLIKEGNDKKENGPLFISNRGTKISIDRVEDIIKEYGRQVLPPNVKVSCHLLRKTCGSRIYEKTSDIALAQQVLGHSDPSTTSKYYINFNEERLKKLRDEDI